MKQKTQHVIVLLLFGVLSFGFSGCGGEKVPELATVKGKLTLNGKPLPEIKVSFMPNPEKECSGRTSFGETDENGEYTLTYQLPDEPKPGAVVGWHKVVLQDLMPSRARDEGGQQKPRRILGSYANSPKTPLEFEVKAGENQADFEVEPNK